jgi:hypothetical protein
VRLTGSPGRVAASATDRDNLPDRVAASVGYRDVRIGYALFNELTKPEEFTDLTKRIS